MSASPPGKQRRFLGPRYSAPATTRLAQTLPPNAPVPEKTAGQRRCSGPGPEYSEPQEFLVSELTFRRCSARVAAIMATLHERKHYCDGGRDPGDDRPGRARDSALHDEPRRSHRDLAPRPFPAGAQGSAAGHGNTHRGRRTVATAGVAPYSEVSHLLRARAVPASLSRRPAQPEAGDLPAWPAGRCLAAPFGRP